MIKILSLKCRHSGSHSYEVRFRSASILLAFDDSEQDARTPLSVCTAEVREPL